MFGKLWQLLFVTILLFDHVEKRNESYYIIIYTNKLVLDSTSYREGNGFRNSPVPRT